MGIGIEGISVAGEKRSKDHCGSEGKMNTIHSRNYENFVHVLYKFCFHCCCHAIDFKFSYEHHVLVHFQSRAICRQTSTIQVVCFHHPRRHHPLLWRRRRNLPRQRQSWLQKKKKKFSQWECYTQAKLHHGHLLMIPTATTTVLRTSPDNSSIFGRHGCQQGNNRCRQKGNIQGFLFGSPGSSRS